MSIVQDICAICAWRIACQKKFSISGRDMRCPDFVKDITIENTETSKKGGDEKVQKTDIDKK